MRFRIAPPELEKIERGEVIRESFPLGAGWHAAIVPANSTTTLQFLDGGVQISLSKNDRAVLSNPENEGIYFQTEGAASIRYLIEKDFPCAHPRAANAMEPATESFSAPPHFEERKNKSATQQ